ncbi:MAG: aconitate hydratase AcnA [Myxococcales bacterium]|nr:aconitate hydratase AcnA [Myxococcales bacterium]
MANQSLDSFSTKSELEVGGKKLAYFSLPKFAASSGVDIAKLPYSLKILLENLLRHEDGKAVAKDDVLGLAKWDPSAAPSTEIAFHPARVVLQDFTGVPAVVDLAAMRDAMAEMGGDAARINPLFPSELVIDHSVQIDYFGSNDALSLNTKLEYQRNLERYQLLRWGQTSFNNFEVVPPGTGIVHQVNLEYLARVVFDQDGVAYPDSLVGTDSHTTMINGIGVLGWGVGGIEAEAAMLGQPINLLVPNVIGFKLHGKLPEGATATDLVLTITRMLRDKGVVAKFVEFFGEGLDSLPLADRATISNMSPEFGSTCAIFPIDAQTVDYVRFSGRSEETAQRIEAYAKAQGLYRTSDTPDPSYTDTLTLDLATVKPTISGPKRPQDKVLLEEAAQAWEKTLEELLTASKQDVSAKSKTVAVEFAGEKFELGHGDVVIAAITSCTNTSNPSVMMGAGLLARNAAAKGLQVKPWVKTSLAPGSRVVTRYLAKSGMLNELEKLKFNVVGYGCTTCIGNSGPLPEPVSQGIREANLVAVSVLSGNRNFEGRINPDVRANYLASPPLVVAYALAGRMGFDFEKDPLGKDSDGKDVFLKDIWPSPAEVQQTLQASLDREMFSGEYAHVFEGDESWRGIQIPDGDRFGWDPKSTYVRRPTFFDGLSKEPAAVTDIEGARVLAMLGESVTSDHISPAGSIAENSPAGRYLKEHGVEKKDFNSYGSRRGNHEVMVRGTFANIRLRNQLAPGTEGGWTRHLPDGEQLSIFDAAEKYRAENIPLVVLAGKEYGSGSSRDWAAKGTFMLGIRAVIAQSYERIHRSNLIGMGVLPLEFVDGQSRESLGLNGEEVFDISGIADGLKPGKRLKVTARRADGTSVEFEALTRIDTLVELDYYRHGGILQYVLRQLAS